MPQGGVQVGRERRVKIQRLSADRMRKCQVKRMQRLPLHARIGDPAVSGVRDQCMSD